MRDAWRIANYPPAGNNCALMLCTTVQVIKCSGAVINRFCAGLHMSVVNYRCPRRLRSPVNIKILKGQSLLRVVANATYTGDRTSNVKLRIYSPPTSFGPQFCANIHLAFTLINASRNVLTSQRSECIHVKDQV